jgi:hypothetical protein
MCFRDGQKTPVLVPIVFQVTSLPSLATPSCFDLDLVLCPWYVAVVL